VNDDPPRLSGTERAILELLSSGRELFGLQLVEQSRGALKRGTVYVTLGRMQDKGYVESRTEPLPPGAIGLPRRWYRPTAYGLRVSNAWMMAARSFAEQELRTGAA
jgi:DNA-binding PadR family transcriptional regulator